MGVTYLHCFGFLVALLGVIDRLNALCLGDATATECYIRDGRECVLPFDYYYDKDDHTLFTTYTDCTADYSFPTLKWCVAARGDPNDADYNVYKEWGTFEEKLNKWGYCYGSEPPPEGLQFVTPKSENCGDLVKTTMDTWCVFPFTYKGTRYDSCTNVDAGNRLTGQNALQSVSHMWCATSSSFSGDESDTNWAECDLSMCPLFSHIYQTTATCNIRTVETDEPCVFPFTYTDGKTYNKCIDNDNDGQLWCSKVSTYTNPVNHFGTCNLDPVDTSKSCADSWSYKGNTYKGCITLDHYTAWCAYTAVYESGEWGNCNLCP